MRFFALIVSRREDGYSDR